MIPLRPPVVAALFAAFLAPLPLKAQNSARSSAIASGTSNNIRPGANYSFIGSGWRNVITKNAAMSFIGSGQSNMVRGNWSVINGGFYNRISPNNTSGQMSFIGGGAYNRIDSKYAMINAGYSNTILGSRASGAVIGAGHYNTNAAPQGTIGGGLRNWISANSATGATISGGRYNEASRPGATVPGGSFNEAAGTNSLAAGSYAVASNSGTFVWGDMSASSDFVSTANNQFLIRAKGGVGINTNNPGINSLAVAGNVQINGALKLNNIQILSGSGTPSMNAPNASIYINSSATSPTNGLFFRFGGVWYALNLEPAP